MGPRDTSVQIVVYFYTYQIWCFISSLKNMIKKITGISFLSILLVPSFSFAQRSIGELAETAIDWINRGVIILITVATLFFIWAVIGYIREKDPAKMKERQKQMINGIIGLFVIVSVWGIIGILSRSLGTDNRGIATPPCPPGTVWSTTGGINGRGACR